MEYRPGKQEADLAIENAEATAEISQNLRTLVTANGILDRGDVDWVMRILARLEGESRGLAAAIDSGIDSHEYARRVGRHEGINTVAMAMVDAIGKECKEKLANGGNE
jgi:hypothetical protein